jgi:hypothetical protein
MVSGMGCSFPKTLLRFDATASLLPGVETPYKGIRFLKAVFTKR